MLTTRLGLTALCLLLLSTTVTAKNVEFWSLQDYLELYPEQLPLSRDFAELVRQPAQALTKPSADTKHIVMLTPDQQVSDYWSRNQLSLRERLLELGIPFTFQSYPSLPATAAREQEQQLVDALASDPDYLIMTLNSERQAVLLDKLMTRDRPKIILMNITTPLKHLKNQQPFFYVGFDHRIGTELLSNRLKELTNHQANYLMLYGTRGYISQARGDEFIQLNKNENKINLAQAFYTDVSQEQAMTAVLKILTDTPSINLIYACTTDISLGAAQALKKLNKKNKIILNGWGGGSAELEAIARGDLDVTVMRMNDDNGVAIAEAIQLDQTGKGHLVPQVYSGEFVIVDQQTSTAELERLKDVAFRYSK